MSISINHRPQVNQHFLASSQVEADTLDRDNIVAVPQGAQAIVSSDQGKSIVATNGVLTCYAVALYNPETRTASLAHIDAMNDEKKVLADMASALRPPHSNQRLIAHIVGGFDMGDGLNASQTQGQNILDQLRSMKNVSIDSVDVGGDMQNFKGIRGLAVDSRTGKTYLNDSIPEDIISQESARFVESARRVDQQQSPVIYDRGVSYLPAADPASIPYNPSSEGLDRLLQIRRP